ncbi:hypothetical protein ACJJIE_03920 [Microbulbifer sp. TRSA001]|uniref:hypothetical protein n=1 Tax=Microbulbifer sp. TRSA001 TaxID=3243381 RepID=UPI0040397B41
MRSNSEIFDIHNQSPQRELRLVIEIGYDLPLYISSHSDISGLPINAILGALKKCSSTSQKLIPEQGRAEIGAMSFEVVDIAGQFSYVLRDELEQGRSIKGLTVRLYRGFAGLDWADFRLEQTQIAEESISYSTGLYRVRCRDIQREMRSDIFVLNSTRLAADFSKTANTLQVFDASAFEANPHTAAYGDAPNQSVYYLKIKYQDGYEIVRATGKTGSSFTGCTRGLFGTYARDHVLPEDSDDESGVEVEEFVYLEGPGPQVAYALLTGDILGTNDVLPSNWHLGIDPNYVVQDQFENIGADWYKPSDHTKGKILRFDGLEKTDGKKFIESEINLLLGSYMPVNASGQLGFRRMAGVLADSGTVAAIGPDDVKSLGELKYSLTGLRNVFTVQWSWFEQPGFDGKYLRSNNLIDADSIATHGEAKQHTLQFRGLHNSRHTYTTIKNTFDALRDRFAGPPLSLRLGLLPSKNDLEVGDIVWVSLPQIRDHSQDVAAGTLDRAMEIQRISIDQTTEAITAELFGSYQPASMIADQSESTSAELPDSWYESEGTEMAAAGLSIDADGFLTADGTLIGSTDSRAIYYHLGDLTIPAGLTLSVLNNVELRVRGVLQIEGSLAGVPGNTGVGFLGSCRGGDGSLSGTFNQSGYIYRSSRGDVIAGRNEVMPPLNIENYAGYLLGIPDDMRGSGGAAGGDSYYYNSADNLYERDGRGGSGGAGGAGLAVVARGIAFGVSGKIDSSGEDASAGSVGIRGVAGGSGGGGAPGGIVLLVDGTDNPMPVLTNSKVVTCYGESPSSPGNAGLGSTCLGANAVQILFVPKSREPYPDQEDPALDPDVEAAQEAAAAAQADADAALEDLGNISADGILHPTEKLQVIREYSQLIAQQAGIETQASEYGITDEKTDYTAAIDALTSYLDGLSPTWSDATQSTPISRSIWETNWEYAYEMRQVLLNKISERAAEGALLAGKGTNLLPASLSVFSGYALPPFHGGTRYSLSIATVTSPPNPRCLHADFTGSTGEGMWFNFRHYDGQRVFKVEEGKTYIISAWSRTLSQTIDVRFELRDADDGSVNFGYSSYQAYGNSFETRKAWTVTATGTGYSYLRVAAINLDAGEYLRFDCLMIEEAIGNQTEPSAFSRPSGNYTDPETGMVFDQRGLPQTVGSIPALPTSSDVLSSSDNGSSAKISIAAHSVQYAGFSISYNSGSITGLAFSTTYYVYVDDADYSGGGVTYYVTTQIWQLSAGIGRRTVGTITTPADGGSTTTPTNPWCVAAGTWLRDGLLADNCQPGDLIECWDVGDSNTHLAPIQAVKPQHNVPCVQLTMESGAQVVCSRETPVTDQAGRVYMAQDCAGVELGTMHNRNPLTWEKVVNVECAGLRTVYKISVGGISFAAGVDPEHRVITHNIDIKP